MGHFENTGFIDFANVDTLYNTKISHSLIWYSLMWYHHRSQLKSPGKPSSSMWQMQIPQNLIFTWKVKFYHWQLILSVFFFNWRDMFILFLFNTMCIKYSISNNLGLSVILSSKHDVPLKKKKASSACNVKNPQVLFQRQQSSFKMQKCFMWTSHVISTEH